MPEIKRPLKVFLCHAHADRDPVRGLYTRLTQDGVDAWFDKAKLLPGQDWELEIRKAVRESDVVVVCLSKQFNQAGFRQKEVRLALDTAMEKPEGEIFIIPARLEECDNLESLRKWHWVDLFEDDGYEMLMRALRARADRIGATLQLMNVKPLQKHISPVSKIEIAEPKIKKKPVAKEVTPDKKVEVTKRTVPSKKITSRETKPERKLVSPETEYQDVLKSRRSQTGKGIGVGLFIVMILGIIFSVWYVVNSNSKVDKIANAPTSSSPENTIFTIEDGFPSSIEVDGLGGQNIKTEFVDGRWSVTQPLGITANQDLIEAVALQVTSLHIYLEMDSGSAPEIFGLDNPQYVVTVGFNGGIEHILDIGDITPTNSGYYVRVDNKNMYVIGISEVEKMLSMLSFLP